MLTAYNVIDENGNEIKIDIIMQFRIEELGKEYIVLTVNDDGTSKDAFINITELIALLNLLIQEKLHLFLAL